jgi:c-di-GMP-binding flagellar brake protein YcgR
MQANRRRHPRIPFFNDIRLRVGKTDLFPIRCTNLSMGGMCVYIGEEFERGTKGKLWMTRSSPEGEVSFEADIKILWIQPVPPDNKNLRTGIEFVKMKRKCQDALLQILRTEATIEPPDTES